MRRRTNENVRNGDLREGERSIRDWLCQERLGRDFVAATQSMKKQRGCYSTGVSGDNNAVAFTIRPYGRYPRTAMPINSHVAETRLAPLRT